MTLCFSARSVHSIIGAIANRRDSGAGLWALRIMPLKWRRIRVWARPSQHYRKMRMARKLLAPVTPGEMLKVEFLTEYGLSQNQLAKATGISPNRIAEIVNNRRRITADTALRLGLYFGNSPEFWMNLQSNYDLKIARRNLRPEDAKRIRTRRAA